MRTCYSNQLCRRLQKPATDKIANEWKTNGSCKWDPSSALDNLEREIISINCPYNLGLPPIPSPFFLPRFFTYLRREGERERKREGERNLALTCWVLATISTITRYIAMRWYFMSARYSESRSFSRDKRLRLAFSPSSRRVEYFNAVYARQFLFVELVFDMLKKLIQCC